MGRFWLSGIVALFALCARGETLVTEAKVLQVTERGYILKVGTEPLAVEDSPETRMWRAFDRAERSAFKADDAVGVRIKTDTDPPLLKEMADTVTWKWLTQIRRDPVKGTIEKVDTKTVILRLADGKSFEFRYSDKTKVLLGGKEAGVSDLAVGKAVFVKSRLLPSLDTWLEQVSDVAIPVKATTAKAKKEKPPAPLPPNGRLDGRIVGKLPPLKMFDILVGVRTFHISYRLDTRFFLDGKKVGPEALTNLQECIVHYSRDKTGRILASKVELFSPRGGY